jgi:hypothetical protein
MEGAESIFGEPFDLELLQLSIEQRDIKNGHSHSVVSVLLFA